MGGGGGHYIHLQLHALAEANSTLSGVNFIQLVGHANTTTIFTTDCVVCKKQKFSLSFL